MTWRWRGCQKVADLNRAKLGVRFAINFAYQSNWHPVRRIALLVENDAWFIAASARDDAGDPLVVGKLARLQYHRAP